MFAVTLSGEIIVSTYNRKEDNREDSIKEEAKVMLETGKDAYFVCMCALASEIGAKICSHYPSCGARGVKKLMKCIVMPRENVTESTVVHILWSRDSDFVHKSNTVPIILSLSSYYPMKHLLIQFLIQRNPKQRNQNLFSKNYSQPFDQRRQ